MHDINAVLWYFMCFSRLWKVILECQRLEIAHNLFAARDSQGYLRVILWPRLSALEAKACESFSTENFDVAVAELAGMLVVPSDDIRSKLMDKDGLTEVLEGERLPLEKWEALWQTLST